MFVSFSMPSKAVCVPPVGLRTDTELPGFEAPWYHHSVDKFPPVPPPRLLNPASLSGDMHIEQANLCLSFKES